MNTSRRKSYTHPRLSSIDELKSTDTPSFNVNKSKCNACSGMNEHILRNFVCRTCGMSNFKKYQ